MDIEKRLERQINIIIDRYEKLNVSLNDVKKYLTGRNISVIIDELSELEIIYLNRNKDKDSKDFKKLVKKLINSTMKDRKYSYMDKMNEEMSIIKGGPRNELERRLQHIVDKYKEKGMTTTDIRSHFLMKRNFNKILSVFHDLESIYNKNKHPFIKFENIVYDMLFYRVLLERKTAEEWDSDEEDDESHIKSYDDFN